MELELTQREGMELTQRDKNRLAALKDKEMKDKNSLTPDERKEFEFLKSKQAGK